MQVSLPKSFVDDFLEGHFRRYRIDQLQFAKKLVQAYKKQEIFLERPIAKMKFDLQGASWRVIVIVKENKITPLLLALKTDKHL